MSSTLVQTSSLFPALPHLAVTFALLLLKTSLTSALQVVSRIRAKTFLLPEDAALMGTSMAQAEAPLAQRCASVWRNDLENIPLFLFAALIFTVLGGSENLAAWLFGTYIVARYLHTVSYLLGRQPWRALCYLASVGTTWTVTLHAVWLALAALNTGAAGR